MHLERKENGRIIIRIFGNTFRFIDNLAAINDSGELKKASQEIYSLEFELIKGKSSLFEGSFFGMDIKIWIKHLSQVLMINTTHFYFPLFQCHIFRKIVFVTNSKYMCLLLLYIM